MIDFILKVWHIFVDGIVSLTSSASTTICEPHKTPSDLFLDGLKYWAAILGLMLLIGFVYKFIIKNKLRECFWNLMDRKGLAFLFFAVWSMGFIVYCVGGYAKGFGMLSVAFMSLIYATKMFVGSSDISAVQDGLHNNAFYMFMFGLSHFLAIMCSLLFVMRQIGYFFVSRVSTWLASHNPWNKKNATFVFWGINDASLLMAESIKEQATRRENSIGSYNLIFVRTHDDAERESEGFTPENMYNKIKIQRRELTRLRHLDCKVVSGSQRLSTLTGCNDGDILRGRLGLHSLCRIIRKRSRRTYIFMFGNDGDANIKAVLNLKNDKTIKNSNVHVDIYCHSRKSAKTRSMEYYGMTHRDENTWIHVIDTSDLSIAQLKLNLECHPVQHVEVNKDATIDSPFNAMIVGFGETGQEALRFLYEFGAFVDSSKHKSKFHCAVFDSKMEERKGLFLSQNPFLRTCNEISLHGYGIDTIDYWRIIEDDLIHSLNYIVICPGNDDLALETASNLCALVIRCKTVDFPKKLTICIRSYDSTNVTRLTDFCNDINAKYQVYGINLVPFGQKKEIFKYERIVDDKLLKMAMDYNYAYEKSPEGTTPEALWFKLMGYKRKGCYCIDEIEDIERKCQQNFCNALHGKTKLHILDQCSSRRDIPNEIRENLARIEHERWMACMHANGWQRLIEPVDNKDGSKSTRLTTRKLHTDLCPWEEIRKWDKKEQQETQQFDYRVLDTTLELDMIENKRR